MKIASFLALALCGTAGVSLARESAYQALRVIGTQRGQEILNHVVEVTGQNGQPQPGSWRVVFEDATARSGVREVEVAKGKIVSERTPVKAYAGTGATMDFQKLNLDSEGLFTIVDKEARKARIGFDAVDYALRASEDGKAPVWTVKLVDSGRRTLGTMQVAADTGALVRSDLYGRKQAPIGSREPRPEPPRYRDEVTVEQTDEYSEETTSGERDTGHEINKALHRAGASIEEFFTGRRTIDRRYQNE